MITAGQLGEILRNHGFTSYTGVPCSSLQPLINYAVSAGSFYMAANEGDAVAIAAGQALAGKGAVVLMQNSGLGNAVSPLTSLIHTFAIPILGFVSLRGETGTNDEPQHELMGQITTALLDQMQIPWEFLTDSTAELPAQCTRAFDCLKERIPFFFVVKKGSLAAEKLIATPSRKAATTQVKDQKILDQLPLREAALKTILQQLDSDSALLTSTGFSGRELFELGHRSGNFYMYGSMGCVSSLALGLALASSRKIIALDGDGALLMRLGSLPTYAHYQPENLLHILLDNGQHESTGGQATVADTVNFVALAQACGVPQVIHLHTLGELKEAISQWQTHPTCTFAYLKIASGSRKDLGRPTLSSAELCIDFMNFLQSKHA